MKNYIIFFYVSFMVIAQGFSQGFTTITDLTPVPVSTNTGEKPQSKVWAYEGKHWAVLPNSSGTHLYRLDGTTWTNVLRLSTRTSSKADCKLVGNDAHILLFQGASSQFVSVEYNHAIGSYQLWSKRTSTVGLNFKTNTETATIDMDGTGRMWLAYDAAPEILVRWSDSPYHNWSAPYPLASNVKNDDICAVVALPGKIGVFWSDQNSRRFGFRTHLDGSPTTSWSEDEVPASQSALDIGAGMADDHMNMAVGNDGTLYAAIKTEYDTPGYPDIGLLVRRSSGTWDDLYPVAGRGTRPIVILNEAQEKVRVIYTSQNNGGNIEYKESFIGNIAFSPQLRLINGSNYDNSTGAKDNFTTEVVILASSNTQAVGVLATDGNTPSVLLPPILSTPTNLYTNVPTAITLEWFGSLGAETYHTQISKYEDFSSLEFEKSGITDLSVSLPELYNNTTYYWRVKASNSKETSDWSAIWSFTTKAASSGTTLIAHWQLDEGSGTTLNDASDYNNNATTSGGPTWIDGVKGKALRFNGSNQFATVPDNASLDLTQSLTIATWIRPEKTATQYLIKKAVQGSIDGYELSLASNGRIFFRFNQRSSSDTYRLNSQTSYPANGNTWMHVAVTYDGTSMKMYIDGVENNSTTFNSPPLIFSNDLALKLGAESNGFRSFQGAMDEVYIFNRALSSTEVYDLAALSEDPSTTNPPKLIDPEDTASGVSITPTLNWNASEGAETYHAQVSTTSDFSSMVFDQADISQTSIVLNALENMTTYYWRVRATNAAGNSEWSDTWNFTTASDGPILISPPTLNYPINNASNISTAPNLSWDASEGAETYQVQVSTGSDFSSMIFDQTNITQTSLSMNNLENSTTYYWRVRATNAAGNSEWSIVWGFTTSPVPTGDLIAHWRMDEGNGTSVSDASQNNNKATTSGGPSWLDGVKGMALRFNGSNQFATAPNHASLNLSQSLTIATWIRPEKTATQYLVKKAVQGSIDGYELSLASTGRVFFRFNQQSSGDTYRLNSLSSYPTNGNTWMHVAVTYDGTSMKMYINGVENNSTTFINPPPITTNELVLALGAEFNGFRSLQGAMDEVYIFNRALSSTEVNDLAALTENPSTTNPPELIAPENTASGISTTPTLNWNASEGAETYHAQVSTVSDFSSMVFDQADIPQTSVALNVLENATTYYWRVRATNAAGNSEWSATWSFTTVSAPPVLASPPTLSSPGNNATDISTAPTLSWNASQDAETYHAQVSTAFHFSSMVFDQADIPQTSVALSALENATTYYWRVRTTNAAGNSEWSATWSFTTAPDEPILINSPTLSSPANNASDISTAPNLSWNASEGAETYHAQVATASDFSSMVFDQMDIPQTSVALNALENSITYYWRVRASNAAGNSEWSATWSFTTASVEQILPSPPTLSSPSNNATDISISPTLIWNATEGAATYHAQVSTASNFSATEFDQSGISQTFLSLNALENATTYYWRIRTTNAAGNSEWSTVWSFTTVQASPAGELIAHWKLDEGSGTTLNDASGFNNTASTTANPVWVEGVKGLALRLNGAGQFATAPDQSSLDIQESITIATWIRPERRSVQYLIHKAESGARNGYELFLTNNGRVSFQINHTSSRVTSQASYPTNGRTWMHVAVTYDGSILRLYINGVENSNSTLSSQPLIGINQLPLTIGASQGGVNGFMGAMDDIMIYNMALSPAHISKLASLELTPSAILRVAPRNLLEPMGDESEVELLAFPNPFSDKSTIKFAFPEDSDYTLALYDSKGTLVTDIIQGEAKAGKSNFFDIEGKKLPSGLYLLRVHTTKGKTKTIRLVLTK